MAERGGPARTLALGVGGGALAAVAGARDWFRVAADIDYVRPALAPDDAIDAPLALSLGLVVLAAWGVVAVTRGRARWLVAWLALAAAAGYALVVVWSGLTLPDRLVADLGEGVGDVGTRPTGWYAAAAVAALLVVAAGLLGVRGVRRWPEMGRRYDAPGGAAAAAVDRRAGAEDDPWRALDHGIDPTA